MKKCLILLLVAALSATSPLLGAWASKDLVMVPHNNLPKVKLTLDMHVRKNTKDLFPVQADENLTVKIKEFVTFSFSASQDGYVSLWNVGSSNKVTQLFPNRFQKNMAVSAGENYRLGQKGQPFGIRANGPEGMENVFLLWTEHERDQPIHMEDAAFNTSSAYDIEDILQISEVDPSNWSSEHLAFDVSQDGLPLVEDFRDVLQKSANKLRMTGVKGNVYLLAMGANTGNLTKAGSDAINFSNAIKSLFGKKVVNPQIYPNAYVRDFRNGMKWLRKNAGRDDLVIIYYSGHGSTLKDRSGDESDKLDEVFVMADVKHADPAGEEHVILDDEFGRAVNALKTNNVVMVLDACYSAGLTKNLIGLGRLKFFTEGVFGVGFRKTLKDWFFSGPEFKKGALIYAAEESQDAYEGAAGGLMTTRLVSKMLNNENVGKSWHSVISNSGVNGGRRVRVWPTIKGQSDFLKHIKFK